MAIFSNLHLLKIWIHLFFSPRNVVSTVSVKSVGGLQLPKHIESPVTSFVCEQGFRCPPSGQVPGFLSGLTSASVRSFSGSTMR